MILTFDFILKTMENIDFGIKTFGAKTNKKTLEGILELLKKNIDNFKIYLVIAGTNTSQLEGISAAGIHAKSREKNSSC